MTDRRFLFALNIVLPLGIGWLFYFLCAPDVRIVSWLPQHLSAVSVPELLRGHLCDMLWAYALTFALSLCFPKGKRLPAPVLGAALSVCMEFAVGVLDIWDMVTEVVACVAAYFVILFFDRRIIQ